MRRILGTFTSHLHKMKSLFESQLTHCPFTMTEFLRTPGEHSSFVRLVKAPAPPPSGRVVDYRSWILTGEVYLYGRRHSVSAINYYECVARACPRYNLPSSSFRISNSCEQFDRLAEDMMSWYSHALLSLSVRSKPLRVPLQL